METHISTTPFGRRPMTLAQVAGAAAARARPRDAVAHKWRVFRALCAAKSRLGLNERALAVLDALLSFHPETVLAGDALVVFPSNAQLALRAHGMSAATLRRHLAALVEAGIVLRRDSPNGKRYARRDAQGGLVKAFGFDLAPLVARAAEFEALAEAERAEEAARRYARERITLARRDIAKMIAVGLAENVAIPGGQGGWGGLNARFRGLVDGLGRAPSRRPDEICAQALCKLAAEIRNVLENHAKEQDLSGNESQFERHIQNSNSESPIEFDVSTEKEGAQAAAAACPAKPARKRSEDAFPLSLVLRACPDIEDYARGGVASWRDLVAAAAAARPALGVSPSAWEAAQATFGEIAAAIVLAAILQRGDAIASAGGYLRELTRKAEAGAFSLGSVLMALLRTRPGGRMRA